MNGEQEFIGGVLYTSKEQKMHVFGPKRCCDLTVFNSPRSHQLSNEEAQHFLKNGFFLGHGLVQPTLLRLAREYINSQYASWLRISRRQDDWRIQLLVDLCTCDTVPVEHAPILDLILQSPLVLEKLEALMGSSPTGTFYNQVAYRTPLVNPTTEVMQYTPGAEYHIDGQANQYGTRFPDPWSVIVGIALVDLESVDMGNFTVFPGTHTSVNWSNYPTEKRSKTLPHLGEPHKVRLRAGSVVFAHVLLPHRGGKNIITPEAANELGIDYTGLTSIPVGTREMVLFRIQAKHIDYLNEQRSVRLLLDPLCEHGHLVNQLKSSI
jgi:hypothetical protein